MNRLMRLSVVTFIVSLGVWGVIAVQNKFRIYELLRTWQIIAIDLAIVSGLVMLALLVHAASGATETLDVDSSARGAGTEGVEALMQSALELVGTHWQEAPRSNLGRFRRDDDIARDDLRSQVLDLRADVVDESAAVGDVDAALGEAELPDPRREDAPRIVSEHLVDGDVHPLHHRGEHVDGQAAMSSSGGAALGSIAASSWYSSTSTPIAHTCLSRISAAAWNTPRPEALATW